MSKEPQGVRGRIEKLIAKWSEDADYPISKHASIEDAQIMQAVKAETRSCIRELREALAAAPEPPKGDDLCAQGEHFDVDGKCTVCGISIPAGE
jgi:hypothetical protein